MNTRTAFQAVFDAVKIKRVDVARRLGWSTARLDHYLQGRRHLDDDDVAAMAMALGISRRRFLSLLATEGEPYPIAPSRIRETKNGHVKRVGRPIGTKGTNPMLRIKRDAAARILRECCELSGIDPDAANTAIELALDVIAMLPSVAKLPDGEARAQTLKLLARLADDPE